jgi:hypothetical protein
MEIVRLTTWIKAPVDRCFRLATSVDVHQIMASLSLDGARKPSLFRQFSPGDHLTWTGHLALLPRYTTRILQVRPYACYREVLEAGCFLHFEHDHHFTPLNEGTRMRDEIRFVIPPGILGPMTTPLVRRYLIWRISTRNSLLRKIAQSGLWKQYLESAPVAQTNAAPPEQVKVRSDAPPRVSTGRMATR